MSGMVRPPLTKEPGLLLEDTPARSATTPPLTLPKCLNPLLFAPPSGIDVALYFYGYVVVLSSASVAVDYVIHCYFHRFYNPRLDRLRLVYRARVADSVMQRKPRARPGKLVAVLIQARLSLFKTIAGETLNRHVKRLPFVRNADSPAAVGCVTVDTYLGGRGDVGLYLPLELLDSRVSGEVVADVCLGLLAVHRGPELFHRGVHQAVAGQTVRQAEVDFLRSSALRVRDGLDTVFARHAHSGGAVRVVALGERPEEVLVACDARE